MDSRGRLSPHKIKIKIKNTPPRFWRNELARLWSAVYPHIFLTVYWWERRIEIEFPVISNCGGC
jgi:hypothetical protein